MNDKLDSRSVYLPRGQNSLEDLNILADCIANSDANIFNQAECVIWITAGKCVPVNPNILRQICTKYVVTKHPRETPDGWEVEYRPYDDEMTLRALLTAKTREEGGLAWRLPKWPSEPVRLSPQRQREVRDRLNMGERPDSIARAYGVDVAAIGQLVR